MEKKPTPRFEVAETAIVAIRLLRSIHAKVSQHDRDLAEQIRSAMSSVALNIGEGNRCRGGNRSQRLSSAAGSNGEVRMALRVAEAWGYIDANEIAAVEEALDRIAAMLYRLGARW